jgi:hypothetical protein
MKKSCVIYEKIVVLITTSENLQESFHKLNSVHDISNPLKSALIRYKMRLDADTVGAVKGISMPVQRAFSSARLFQ